MLSPALFEFSSYLNLNIMTVNGCPGTNILQVNNRRQRETQRKEDLQAELQTL